MTQPFPETSFLCALYRKQIQTPQAIDLRESIPDPLPVSPLVLFEFRQSVRLQVRLHRNDRRLVAISESYAAAGNAVAVCVMRSSMSLRARAIRKM